MADNAPALIWVSGPDKLCTFFNKTWLDFTGRTMEQELGNGWAENVHPDDMVRCMDVYSSSFDERRSFQMEYRLRRADGEYRWVLDNGVPRVEPNGGFAGYMGSCIDITDLKRSQGLDLARQKLETMGSVASAIAHDFGNLLAGDRCRIQKRCWTPSPAVRFLPDEVEVIRNASFRGAEIARRLMSYAEPESVVVERVNVSRTVEDMLDLLKNVFAETYCFGNSSGETPGTGASESCSNSPNCDEPRCERFRCDWRSRRSDSRDDGTADGTAIRN